MNGLKRLVVKISDSIAGPIEILIEADLAGKLLKDQRIRWIPALLMCKLGLV